MKKKAVISAVMILFLLAGGTFLFTKGRDAVTVASDHKGSILTAEQVNVSFQQVGGKVTEVLTQEEQQIKKGDVLMRLDPTDTDLDIAKLIKDIDQMDVQIKQTNDSIRVGYEKVATQKQQAVIGIQTAEVAQKHVYDGARDEDIRQQQIAVQSAQDSYEDTKKSFNRSKELFQQGAISKAEYDSITTAFSLADKKVKQQQESLAKLLAGPTAEEKQQAVLSTEKAKTALAQVDQARQDLDTNKIGVEKLQKQKESLEVQLKALKVKKDRLTLRAPQDGKVIKVVAKLGENVSAGAPVIMMETDQLYYDVYVDEMQVTQVKVGGDFTSHLVALNEDIKGKVRFITAAPQFANLRMSREKGQADLSTFQVRVYVQRTNALLPGMTVEVKMDAVATK